MLCLRRSIYMKSPHFTFPRAVCEVPTDTTFSCSVLFHADSHLIGPSSMHPVRSKETWMREINVTERSTACDMQKNAVERVDGCHEDRSTATGGGRLD